MGNPPFDSPRGWSFRRFLLLCPAGSLSRSDLGPRLGREMALLGGGLDAWSALPREAVEDGFSLLKPPDFCVDCYEYVGNFHLGSLLEIPRQHS